MFERVLVPLDSSPLSDRVLSAALRVTDPKGELLVLRIQGEAASLDPDVVRSELDFIDSETQAVLQRATSASIEVGQTATIRAEVRSGPLAATIVAAADELEVDCIVMGTHGRKGITEQLTGSVTEQVVARAAPSVFVVKAPGYPFLQD